MTPSKCDRFNFQMRWFSLIFSKLNLMYLDSLAVTLSELKNDLVSGTSELILSKGYFSGNISELLLC